MASEKPNIPIIGPIYEPPEAASTSKVPTIGPVQENETKAKVKAIKKIPIKPPRSEAESALLIHELGMVSSNAPKKEAAKITSKKKKAMLKYTLVAILFRASAPKIAETATPKIT